MNYGKIAKVVGSPKFLMRLGVGLIIGGTAATVYGTIKAVKIHEQYKQDRLALTVGGKENHDSSYVPTAKDLMPLWIKTTGKYALAYAPAAGMMIAGLLGVTKAYKKVAVQLAGVTSAYLGLKATMDKIQERVIADQGEDKWNEYRYGIKTESIEEVNPETGKTKKVKMSVVDEIPDDVIVWSNETAPYEYDPSEDLARLKFQCQEAIFTNNLTAGEPVYLNDILEPLGLSRTRKGAVTGWLPNGGDGYVNLRAKSVKKKDEYGRWTTIWILDPNIDGVIIDDVDDYAIKPEIGTNSVKDVKEYYEED